MKLWFILIALSFNAFADIEGTWESPCGISDLPNATLCYDFHDEQVEVYIQHYEDSTCSVDKKLSKVLKSAGSYKISHYWGRPYQLYLLTMGNEIEEVHVFNGTLEIFGHTYTRH